MYCSKTRTYYRIDIVFVIVQYRIVYCNEIAFGSSSKSVHSKRRKLKIRNSLSWWWDSKLFGHESSTLNYGMQIEDTRALFCVSFSNSLHKSQITKPHKKRQHNNT
jgi:hypothetical protein